MESAELRNTDHSKINLVSLSERLRTSQPSYSRYCMFRANTSQEYQDAGVHPHCKMCHTLLSHDNHKVRIAPRMPLTKKLKKLIQSCASISSTSSPAHSRLSRCQKKLIKRYLNSSNVMVISCNVCGKSTKMKGQSRSDRMQQLVSWKHRKESSQEEAIDKPLNFEKKNNSKKTYGVVTNLATVVKSNKLQPIVADFLKLDKQRGPIGSPLVTSTPVTHNDDSGISSSKSLKSDFPKTVKNSSIPSPVFALLGGHQSVVEGGVKKKKKRKHKHQHLEKLLQKQMTTDNATKTERKNSLAAFLSEMSH